MKDGDVYKEKRDKMRKRGGNSKKVGKNNQNVRSGFFFFS